jgi:hypothetical protein
VRPSSRKLALAAFLGACSGNQEAGAKHSAARVTRAVEVLRAAPNPAKAALLDGLARLPCDGPDVCETREVCAAAFGLHVEGLALTEAARLQLSSGNGVQAAKLLGSAEEKLKLASTRVAACTDRESALRRRYKL